MTYFPKTSYRRPLVHNAESVDETTNPYFKNTRTPSVAENEAEFVLAKHNFSIRLSMPVFTETFKI